MSYAKIEDMLGKTLIGVDINEGRDVIDFATTDGEKFRLYHTQDCCETVSLNEVIGDMMDLIGSPLLEAECVESENDAYPKPDDYSESWTWTFYKLGTIKGRVTLRWLGESNGYYSERVDFDKVSP